MLASRAAKTHASPPRPGANQSAFALAICSAISLNFVSSPTGHISVMHVRGMVVLLTTTSAGKHCDACQQLWRINGVVELHQFRTDVFIISTWSFTVGGRQSAGAIRGRSLALSSANAGATVLVTGAKDKAVTGRVSRQQNIFAALAVQLQVRLSDRVAFGVGRQPHGFAPW